jgi:hypothetical protein
MGYERTILPTIQFFRGYFLLMVVILISGPGGCQSDKAGVPTDELKGELQIVVAPTKARFRSSEPLFSLKVTFINLYNRSIWLNKAVNFSEALCELRQDVILPGGSVMPAPEIKLDGRRGELSRQDFVRLKPGQQFEVIQSVKQAYRFAGVPGMYQVTLTYSNRHSGKPFGIDAWTGEIKSNKTSFEVIEETEKRAEKGTGYFSRSR